jgi:pimeloyl-ACP methyl ester carboxylesterase
MIVAKTIEAGADSLTYSFSAGAADVADAANAATAAGTAGAPGGRTTPVVLVHGWGGSRTDWHETIELLGDAYTIVALDLPPAGDSSSRADEVTIGSYADDVAAVMDAEGLAAAIVVGHSLGGAVVAEFAARHPQRTLKVVGVDTYHYLQLYPKQTEESVAAFSGGFLTDVEVSVDALIELSSVLSTPDDVKAQVRASTLKLLESPLAMTGLLDCLRWDLDAALRRIDEAGIPVAMIAASDLLSAEATERYGERMLIIGFPAMSHYMTLEDPQGLADRLVIAFEHEDHSP